MSEALAAHDDLIRVGGRATRRPRCSSTPATACARCSRRHRRRSPRLSRRRPLGAAGTHGTPHRGGRVARRRLLRSHPQPGRARDGRRPRRPSARVVGDGWSRPRPRTRRSRRAPAEGPGYRCERIFQVGHGEFPALRTPRPDRGESAGRAIGVRRPTSRGQIVGRRVGRPSPGHLDRGGRHRQDAPGRRDRHRGFGVVPGWVLDRGAGRGHGRGCGSVRVRRRVWA